MEIYEDIEEVGYNQPLKRWQSGTVYLLDYGDGKTFKIGFTSGSVENRMNQICKGNVIMPMKLVMSAEVYTNAFYVENLLHMMFDDYHVRGEWFEFGDEFPALLEFYDKLHALSMGVDITDHWFDLVPEEYLHFVDKFRPVYRPFMTREKQKKWHEETKDVFSSTYWKDLYGTK